MPSTKNLHLTLSLLLSILPLLSSSSQLWQDPIRTKPYIINYRNGTILRDTTNLLSSFPPPNDTIFKSKDITINIPSYACHLRAQVFPPAQANSNRTIPILVYFQGDASCIGSPFSKGDTVYKTRVIAKAHVIFLSLDCILYPDGGLPQTDQRAQIQGLYARIRPLASPHKRPL